MTYQIQITPSKQGEFLQIVDSLLKLGVVEKYHQSESLVVPGEPVNTDALLALLKDSEKQIEEGLAFSTAEAKVFLKAWQQRKQ